MTLTLTLLILTSLGVLTGSIVFLSLVLAPVVFQALDAPAASRLLRAVFPRYYRLGLLCCGLGLGAAVALATKNPGFVSLSCVMALSIMTAITAYSLRLVPRINAARDGGATSLFEALHRRSVFLNALTLIFAVGTFALAGIAA